MWYTYSYPPEMMYSPATFSPLSSPTPLTVAPSPIYTVLILGMTLFLLSTFMPNLLPIPDQVLCADPVRQYMAADPLQPGRANGSPVGLRADHLCASSVQVLTATSTQLTGAVTQMMGLMPGVPQLHITYVHLTIAFLLYVPTLVRILTPASS